MAHATRTEAEVTIPVICLDLTLEEAATLRQVCERIGGSGQGRKDMDAILDALIGLGVDPAGRGLGPGSIYFD